MIAFQPRASRGEHPTLQAVCEGKISPLLLTLHFAPELLASQVTQLHATAVPYTYLHDVHLKVALPCKV